MTTLLLVWYSLGWVGIASIAIHDDEVTAEDVVACFVCAPVVGPIFLVFSLGKVKLWRKP